MKQLLLYPYGKGKISSVERKFRYKKSKELTKIIRKVDSLSAEEQLSLISYLTNRIKMCEIKQKAR